VHHFPLIHKLFFFFKLK